MRRKNKTISFVIPCYLSGNTLPRVAEEIRQTMDPSPLPEFDDYEILFVCDGSPDDTAVVIRQLASRDSRIRGIYLSRNRGQHGAVLCGLKRAGGDVIVCLDDDLQTPPRACVRMIRKLEEGYDVVYARYPEKRHSAFRNLGSLLNACLQTVLYQKPKGLRTSSYFVMRRAIAAQLVRYRHGYPYLSGMVLRTTNRIANVPVSHRARAEGKSTYTLFRLARLVLCAVITRFVSPGKSLL